MSHGLSTASEALKVTTVKQTLDVTCVGPVLAEHCLSIGLTARFSFSRNRLCELLADRCVAVD
jgi:hypothetical protein